MLQPVPIKLCLNFSNGFNFYWLQSPRTLISNKSVTGCVRVLEPGLEGARQELLVSWATGIVGASSGWGEPGAWTQELLGACSQGVGGRGVDWEPGASGTGCGSGCCPGWGPGFIVAHREHTGPEALARCWDKLTGPQWIQELILFFFHGKGVFVVLGYLSLGEWWWV